MTLFKKILITLSVLFVFLAIKRDELTLEEKHYYFLEKSPFKNTKKLSRKARKALGIPPNAYYERFFELTMNPSLGYPTVSKKIDLQNKLADARIVNEDKKSKNQVLTAKTPGVDQLNPWISIGPNDVGGRTRGALFDLNDNEKDRVIAGGVSGGLWVNEDIDASGTSPWSEVTGVPGNLAVSVIVQDPNHTNVMYAGTGESYTGADALGNGVYKSTDYGQNWTLVLGNATGTATTTSINATQQFVEGYFFINDLQIWDPTPSDTSNNDEYIFALLGQGFDSTGEITEFFDLSINGLYLSTDGGSVWSKIALPSLLSSKDYHLNDIEVDPNNNKIWISSNYSRWGYSGGNFYWSSDGANFTKITPSYPSNANSNIFRVEFAASATTSDTFYVLLSTIVSSQAEIYKTVDGFSTLTKLNEPNDADTGIPSTDFTRGQSFYDLEIEVDPNNEDIVYVGGIDLFRSVDGGTNWSQISKWSNNNNLAALPVSIVHADQHGIYFKPGDSDKAVIVNDGGVYFANSLSSASTNDVFNSQESGFVTTQFYKVAQSPHDYATDLILGGTQDNGTLLLQNSDFTGLTGSSEFSGGDGGFSYIDQVDTKYMISNYIYNDAVLLYSLNNTTYSNGQNSIYLSSYSDGDASDDTEGDFINPGALDSNQDILYVNGSKSGSYKIRCFYDLDTNVPDDYYITGLPSEPSAFHVSTHTATSTTLLVGTDDGKILLITDADNINLASTQIADFIGSVSNLKFGANENEIYASLYNYGVNNVYFSNDRGVSWTAKDGDLPDIPVLAIQPNPFNPEEVILGTDLGVWMTKNFSNNSPNWIQSNNGMTDVRVNDFEFTGTSVDNNRVIASTYGRGIFVGSFNSDDVTPPTVTLTDDDDDDILTSGVIVQITATFSENMSLTPTITIDLPTNSDIVTTMTQSSTAAIWYYDWTVAAGDTGTATITVAGNDIAGNAYTGTESLVFDIDTTSPTLTITIDDDRVNNTDTPTITFTLTESSTSFTASDLSLSSGSISSPLTATSSTVYTASYTPAVGAVTTVIVSVDSATFTDMAGNSNIASSTTFLVDTISPTLYSFTDDHIDSIVRDADTVELTATFSEAMTTTPTISITGVVTGVAMTASTTSASRTWSYSWNVPSDNNGNVAATVSGTDLFGNYYSGTESLTYRIDNVSPTLTITKPAGTYSSQSVVVTLTYDETVTGLTTNTADFSEAINIASLTLLSASTDGKVYTILITPTANGLVKLTHAPGSPAVTDLAGNTISSTVSCSFIYDGSPPTIDQISSPMTNGTYTDYDGNNALSDTVTITVSFTESVTVNTSGGSPRLLLNTTPASYVYYFDGSGTATLTFNNTVNEKVVANRLNISAFELNGGTIVDLASNTASLTLAYVTSNSKNVTDLKNIALDAKNPTISNYSLSDNNNLAPIPTTSANDGNIATFGFQSDKELLLSSLTVTFTGFTTTVTKTVNGIGPFSYEISFTVSSTFPEGDVEIDISATDQVTTTVVPIGNPTGIFTEEAFPDRIRIDRTAPTITSNANLNSDENTTSGPTITASEGVVFSIVGGADQALLSIGQLTGVLTFSTAPDYEDPIGAGADNTYEIIVKAIDAVGLTVTQTVTIQINDLNDTFGVEVTQTDIQTTESGETASIGFVLITQPTANVTIGLSLSDITEGSLSTTQLIFTPDSWNTAQTISINGVDDGLKDGDVTYQLITANTTSNDATYNGLVVDDVTLTNIDDEIDTDSDGYYDYEDAFPTDPNEYLDSDSDGLGNNTDTDDDGDGISDIYEIELGTDPIDPNDTPSDFNSNGIPDALEDSDGDGYNDDIDLFPLDPTSAIDNDGDGISDTDDTDDDNDGIPDDDDDFPLDSRYSKDTDNDGIPNLIDPDDDGDGYDDGEDVFPLDGTEHEDTDLDGIGNNSDLDIDGDNVLNIFDICPDTHIGEIVDEYGCSKFILSAMNFFVSKIEKCAGENEISIAVVDTLVTYNVAISGAVNQTDSFSSSNWTLEGLSSGVYTICITVDGVSPLEFERCFEVTIEESDPLLVSSLYNKENQTVSFDLSGGSAYQITHNGKTTQTSSSKHTVQLDKGINNISISTGIECQGLFENTYLNSYEVKYAPNPFKEQLQLFIGGKDNLVEIGVYASNGQLINYQTVSLSFGMRNYSLNTSSYKQGVYIIKVKGQTLDQSIQVIKE
ncbi:Ig-like domain-containing protein [Flavobacteriaceae bacterium]|nr:Ig-like domain-containing protein [Flavobacteriaceae bacterium]